MINLALTRVFLPVALAAAAWFWFQAERTGRQVDDLRDDKARLARSISKMKIERQQAMESAAVARAHADRLRSAAEEYNTLREWIIRNDDQTPVPPVLRGAIDRLRH